jgi:hypothetical protein
VATNIAEASVTIDGVKWVVDCGFVKVCQTPGTFGFDSQNRHIDPYIQPKDLTINAAYYAYLTGFSDPKSWTRRTNISWSVLPALYGELI